MSIPAHVEAQIQRTDSCWLWLGCKNWKGYGHLTWRGQSWKAHRLIYTLAVGEIPDGLTLDHTCRVRHCVNPEHLEPVSVRENVLRGVGLSAANARKTHCKHGHEFTIENTYMEGRKRRCRECIRQRQCRYYWRTREPS